MTPVKQTILHDPEKGINGNCFPACIASLLNMSIEDIPNFVDSGDKWYEEFSKFVEDLGHEAFVYAGSSILLFIEKGEAGIDGYYILSGQSPRGEFLHAVLYNKTTDHVFDPHPSGDFILTIDRVYMIKEKKAPLALVE